MSSQNSRRRRKSPSSKNSDKPLKPLKPKKKPKFNQQAALRGAWRRVFSRSPIVREVLQDARREVPKYNKDGTRSKKDSVQYNCYVCKEWVGSTGIQVDHIIPVVDPHIGFVNWEVYEKRLFCGKENLGCICETCHKAKTDNEKAIAKERRKKEKESVK